jgi:hypothetical protein
MLDKVGALELLMRLSIETDARETRAS